MDEHKQYASDKLSSVMSWLKSIFGDQPIPSFQKSNDFIDHLYELMTLETALRNKYSGYQQFIDSSIENYKEASTLKKSLIDELGLSALSMSAETSSLASIMTRLSLSAVDESSCVLALTDLTLTKEETTSELESLNSMFDIEREDLANAKRLNAKLCSLVNNLEEGKKTQQKSILALTQDTEFLKSKLSRYKSDQRKLEDRLTRSGLSSSLTHCRLVADQEQLVKVRDQLEEVQDQLDQFACLPPDTNLAEVKVAVAREQLHEIEAQLLKQIDLSNL